MREAVRVRGAQTTGAAMGGAVRVRGAQTTGAAMGGAVRFPGAQTMGAVTEAPYVPVAAGRKVA
ncbi:hypothetical protein [Streptosporangium sp. NBC_01756]|uniref:hypothetical protein n=1 Tax=Streptosporangium sp. NBC_01756 TaxID=2975950 RepID=UPI002DD975D8|nr:hypothetical protein [Streptosporangium sp. NBC_01756]WSC87542.1 hypothetical protein OIE48_04840 [Streptosporangium sp. NBC_01756]